MAACAGEAVATRPEAAVMTRAAVTRSPEVRMPSVKHARRTFLAGHAGGVRGLRSVVVVAALLLAQGCTQDAPDDSPRSAESAAPVDPKASDEPPSGNAAPEVPPSDEATVEVTE